MWKWLILLFPYFSATSKKYDDEFSCEVSHGARPTAKKYSVSESTVRGFVKLLKWQQADNPDIDFISPGSKEKGSVKTFARRIR